MMMNANTEIAMIVIKAITKRRAMYAIILCLRCRCR